MSRFSKTVVALALGTLAPLAMAQSEGAPPIPDFLQGLSEQQLNSKPIKRFLHNFHMRAERDGSFPDAPGVRVLPQINALSAAAVTAFPYVLNSRWTAVGPQPVLGEAAIDGLREDVADA